MEGSSITCLEIELPEFDHGYHYHPEVEITWVCTSTGERLIGDVIEPFGKDDLVLIGPNLPHRYRNWRKGMAIARVIQFRQDLFGREIFNLNEFAGVRDVLNESARGISFSPRVKTDAMRVMGSLFGARKGADRLLHLIELLSILGEDSQRKPVASAAYDGSLKTRKVARLERVLNYLEQNWRDPVRLDEVATVAALHPQSLSRFFRQHLGMNFQEYLIQLRVARAANLLLRTEDTVVEIAFQCGFNHPGNFNKHFLRHYGMTPGAYRKHLSLDASAHS
jgi:AraC-like DNA-binding protein